MEIIAEKKGTLWIGKRTCDNSFSIYLFQVFKIRIKIKILARGESQIYPERNKQTSKNIQQ